MHSDNVPHDHIHEDPQGGSPAGITFNHEGTKYTVSVAAALSSGLTGHSDRLRLPDGTLLMMHPHIHEDNANTPESIVEKGGKIWQIERSPAKPTTDN